LAFLPHGLVFAPLRLHWLGPLSGLVGNPCYRQGGLGYELLRLFPTLLENLRENNSKLGNIGFGRENS